MIPVGELSVLNCAEGDIRVSLDPANPVDVARGERIIKDMLKRGYMLFVDEGDGKWKRAIGFDSEKKEYLIAEGPYHQPEFESTSPVVREGVKHADVDQEAPEAVAPPEETGGAGGKKGKGKGIRRVSASKARATGVAPTAGG